MAESKKIMVIVAAVLLVFLAILAAGEGALLWQGKQNRAKIELLNKRLAAFEAARHKDAAKAAKQAAAKAVDPYEGWLTYNNSPAGYSLRYPADWTYVETASTESGPANFVTFRNPDQKYAVSFGLRPAGSDLMTSGRTGLGQGESFQGGTVTILGELIDKTYHVNNGHALVVFYGPGAAAAFTAAGNEINAELGAPGLDWEATELRGIPEEAISDKIVTSLSMN